MSAKIVASAVRTTDGKIWSLPAPAGHINVLEHIRNTINKIPVGATAGFITDEDVFYDREAAYVVAKEAGQLLYESDTEVKVLYHDMLF